MIGTGIAVLVLALFMYVLLRSQRTCGKRQHDMQYTCVRVSLRPCHEHIVYAQGPVQPFERSWWVDWSEHVWSTDEYLETGRSRTHRSSIAFVKMALAHVGERYIYGGG